MKALVTGGAGFIGSHLVDRLLADGHSVTVIDNFSSGTRKNLRFSTSLSSTRLEIANVDITDAKKVNKVFSEGKYNAVFHLAAQADVRKSLLGFKGDLNNNVVGTLNILEAMKKYGVNDLVFASSSAVYGEATVRPTPEDYSPIQTSLYGASKLACEAFAEAYTEFTSIRLWAFRFANVIGERCQRGVIGDFVRKLLKNPKELEILGDGKQSKEYLYVKDCINGMITGHQRSSEKANIFNLGVNRQTIVDEIASIVIEEMGLENVKRKYTGGNRGWIGDNPIVELSLNKIKDLGWNTEVSSEEAIRRTARWNIENEQAEVQRRR
jgi:UDP-glucose 4-epimerase